MKVENIHHKKPLFSFEFSRVYFYSHKTFGTTCKLLGLCRYFSDGAIILLCWGFPGGSDGKESACNEGDPGSIPGSRRSPGERNGYPLQYSCLENSMDIRTWQATAHRVAESDTTERLKHPSKKGYEFSHMDGLWNKEQRNHKQNIYTFIYNEIMI